MQTLKKLFFWQNNVIDLHPCLYLFSCILFNPSSPAQQYLTLLGVSGQQATAHLVIIDLFCTTHTIQPNRIGNNESRALVIFSSFGKPFGLDRTKSATWFPKDLKPKSGADARTITSEIITANDRWEFQLEPLNLQDTHFDNCQAHVVLFQSSVYILRGPQNLNEVRFV